MIKINSLYTDIMIITLGTAFDNNYSNYPIVDIGVPVNHSVKLKENKKTE